MEFENEEIFMDTPVEEDDIGSSASDPRNQEIHTLFGPVKDSSVIDGANEDSIEKNVLKTRYTIHRLIKNKKQLGYTFALVILLCFAMVSAGISIYIHNFYSQIQYDLVSFGHYSKITFDVESSFLFLNNDLISFEVMMAETNLPPYTSPDEFRSIVLDQVNQGTNITKEQISMLRKDNSMSKEVWLSTWTLLETAKVDTNTGSVSFDRSVQDSISLFLQAYNLEIMYSSLSQSPSTQYYQQLKVDIISKLKSGMLTPLYDVFKSGIESKLQAMLVKFSGQENNSYTATIVCLALFTLVYFVAVLLIDVEFTKKLDGFIRLFYGFRTQDCKEIIKRCERLMDKIQASQFNDDEDELLAMNDIDHVLDAKPSRDSDYIEIGSRRRKGKGSLIKVVSLRMGLVMIFLVGTFFLKFYSLESHRLALEDLSIVYETGMVLDKFQTHLTACTVWLTRSCLQPDVNLNRTIQTIEDTKNIWSDFQLVRFIIDFDCRHVLTGRI